jgi:Uma2 family endonuclease
MNQTVSAPAPVLPDRGELTGPVVLFPMTSDQFDDLPVSPRFRLELLNGMVVMSPSPRAEHQVFVADLYAFLKPWLAARNLGRLFPGTDMRLTNGWTPSADLALLRAANLARVQGGRIVGPADLAVEVLSPSHPELDLDVKFTGYAQNGIPWYWIIDLDARALDEYELVGSAYNNHLRATFDQPFAPRLFPGLTIDLASLA